MFKVFFASLVLTFGMSASAYELTDITTSVTQSVFDGAHTMAGVSFKEGDTATYNMDMMGFIKGTMVMSIKSVSASEVVISQDVNMMGQKQSCESTIDPNTGKVISLICNGQAQDTSGNDDMQIEDMSEDNITVPAGTFQCIHIIAKTGDGKKIEQWANPKLVPIGGMIKTIAPGPLGGNVTVVLASYKKN